MPIHEKFDSDVFVISTHISRWKARKNERKWQELLSKDLNTFLAGMPLTSDGRPIPPWATGVKVVRSGRHLWSVVATKNIGH